MFELQQAELAAQSIAYEVAASSPSVRQSRSSKLSSSSSSLIVIAAFMSYNVLRFMSEWYNASTLIDANLEAGRGERTAIWSGNERITYRSLFDRVCAMSRALRALGVERENRVLLVLSDTPPFPVAFFGAMRIGAIPVPVNPLYKAEDFRYFLEDSYARVVITEAACLDKLKQALDGYRESVVVIVTDGDASESPVKVLSFDELLAAHIHSGGLSPLNTHRDDMAFWLYSSGSTGKPKGVVHLHRIFPPRVIPTRDMS